MRRRALLATLALVGVQVPPGREEKILPDRYDLDEPVERYELPGRLREASGLAWADEGVLYVHDDERGVVYRVDPQTGRADRGFRAGNPVVHDDFEGIAVADGRVFLVSSRGLLYELRAAPEGETSPVRVSDTGLGPECEVEGLTYLASSRMLALVCKSLRSGAREIRIHRLPLDPGVPAPPVLRVPFEALEAYDVSHGVHPSGLDVDPATGTYVLLAAREERMLEVDTAGRVLAVVKLRHHRHPQAEGITFSPDGRLFIADEGQGRHAHLTAYAPRPPGGTP